MTCGLYDSAVQALFEGGIDVTSDTLKVVFCRNTYTHSFAHDFLSSIVGGARVSTQTLTGVAVSGTDFSADDFTITALTGSAIYSFVIYKDTGVEATSQLIYFSNDVSQFPFTPDGSDFAWTWPSPIFSIEHP